jgi:hypothetical protein
MGMSSNNKTRWFLVLTGALASAWATPNLAATENADGLRVTDYFLSHSS